MPVLKAYWKVIKPKTCGVKVVVQHSHEKGRVILVLHSYGNRTLWNLPGGTYNPKRETAVNAAVREVKEELGAGLLSAHEVGVPYQTSAEGKRDIVTIVTGTVDSADLTFLDGEILEARWEDVESVVLRDDVARVAKHAIRQVFHP